MPSSMLPDTYSAANPRKSVRFNDSYSPSSVQLRFKLGPNECPSLILKISITFDPGRLPRVKVKTKRPRSRLYVEDSDDAGAEYMEEEMPGTSLVAEPSQARPGRETVEVRPAWANERVPRSIPTEKISRRQAASCQCVPVRETSVNGMGWKRRRRARFEI